MQVHSTPAEFCTYTNSERIFTQTLVARTTWWNTQPQKVSRVSIMDTQFFHSIAINSTRYPFNDLFSKTTWVRWQQKGKPFLILINQEMMAMTSTEPRANHFHLTPDR